MREQLCERNLVFPTLCELGPELCCPSLEVDAVFLQYMQDTCAADSFRRRPHQNKCVACPRVFTACIPKSAAKVDDRLPILPNRHRSPELAKFLEILVKQRLQSLKKLAALQLHC